MLPVTHMLSGLLLGAAHSAPSAPAPRLELNVFEANGDAARVDANDSWRWDPPARVLYCVRCPKGESPRPRFDTPAAAGSTSPGRGNTVFFVEPGGRYVYAYVGKDFAPIEGEVTIAPNTPLTVRELRIEPDVKKQALRIHLLKPDSSPLAHDFQVSIESVATGLTLFRSELEANQTRYGDVLPVGRYRVRFETEESVPSCISGWLPESAPFGDWVEIVDLAADQPVEIESFLWFGGKLRVALEVPRDMESRDKVWHEQFPSKWEPPELDWLMLGTKGPGARVTLRPDPDIPAALRERGMPELSGTTVRFFGTKITSGYGFDVLLPGDEQTSADWIPPGAYIARIEARDFAPVEAKVRIQVDETTELRVKLTPR